MLQNIVRKISSRKFLTCVAGIVMGVCMVFGLDEGTVSTIAGAVTAVSSVVMYIYAEGKIDAAAVPGIKDAADKVVGAMDAVGKIEG